MASYFSSKKSSLAIFLVLIIGGFFRLYRLGQIPPGLLQDEASLGYNAISLVETGKDEYGASYPFTFKSFGDYKPPVYVYITAIIYKLIGWQDYLPRVASALAGTISIGIIGLWIKNLTKSSFNGLLGATIFAFNPWSIHLSRVGLESNLALFFFLLGLLFYELITNNQPNHLSIFAALLSFSLSAYTFHSYRFIVIAYLSIRLLLSIKLPFKARFFISNHPLALTTLVVIAIFPGLLDPHSRVRFQQTYIGSPEAQQLMFAINRDSCHVFSTTLPSGLIRQICQLIWNKYTMQIHILLQNLITHLSPQYLFFTGDQTMNRNPTGTGEFFFYLFPLFVIGFAFCLKNTSKRHLITGFFISLIPAILTGPPHSTRLSSQIPFIVIFIVLGFRTLFNYSQKAATIFGLLLFISTGYFALRYAAYSYSGSQNFIGQGKEIMQTAYQYYLSGYTLYFDQDVISEPHILFAFWNHLDPYIYQNSEKEYSVDKFGFTRPSQLGDNIFFQSKEVDQYFCRPKSTNKIVYITNQNQKYPPQIEIMNYSRALRLAAFYDLSIINSKYCTPSPTTN